MKRILLYFTLSIVCLSDGAACGPFERNYLTKDYYVFRACGKDMTGSGWTLAKERSKANCKAWADLTSSDIPLDDIYEVVYDWTIDSVEDIRDAIDSFWPSRLSNRFAKWLVRHKDYETLDFLYVAKSCEKIRAKQNTLWYYPVDGDDYNTNLEKVIEKAKAYKGKRLRDRYDLQAIRALFSQQQYGECVNYWLQHQGDFSEGVIKDMAVEYIVGAYIRLKQEERAVKLNMENGNPHSAAICGMDKKNRFEKVYRWNPDDGWLIAEVQHLIHDLEGGWWGYSDYVMKGYQRIYNQVLNICEDKVCQDMAPWYYTRAFLAYSLNKYDDANTYIVKTEQVAKDRDLLDVTRVLKILVRTRITSRYDLDFENYLFKELKWLDKMIVENLDKETRSIITENGISNHICGYSQYYWSDVLRRILITDVVPLCIRSDYKERALAYLNYADNRIFGLVNQVRDGYWKPAASDEKEDSYVEKIVSWEAYRSDKDMFNRYDYSNDFFINLDSLGVEPIQHLAERLEHPQNELDRFLAKRSYSDTQFLYDIIGTKLIASMKYKEAVGYLSKVSADFNRSRNVFEYCTIDPFTEKKLVERDAFYKLNFAKEMVSLEERIAVANDVNMKASLMLTYARGLQNSIGRKSWLLTSYYRGSFLCYPFYSDYQKNMMQQIEERSMSMIDEALAMYTDRKMAAQACYDMKKFKTAATKYPETDVARFIVGHCDRLNDYIVRPVW